MDNQPFQKSRRKVFILALSKVMFPAAGGRTVMWH